jgi:WD40 repeat protein
VKQRKSLKTLDEHKRKVDFFSAPGEGLLAFSPDGNLLASAASASDDGTVILWDVKQQKYLKALDGHQDTVFHLTFSPDGRLLASASWDKTVILWDVEQQKHLKTLDGHEGEVFSLSFSPDGKLLASASNNETVILWDVSTRQKLETLRGHEGGVLSVSFSPDGKRLASASNDETVILWGISDISSDSWRDRARRIANRNMTLEEWRTYMGEREYRKIFEDLPGPLDASITALENKK